MRLPIAGLRPFVGPQWKRDIGSVTAVESSRTASLTKRVPMGNTRTVLVAEDDPDVFTSDRHIARSRSRGLSAGAVNRLAHLTRFTPSNVGQRHALLNVLWEAAG